MILLLLFEWHHSLCLLDNYSFNLGQISLPRKDRGAHGAHITDSETVGLPITSLSVTPAHCLCQSPKFSKKPCWWWLIVSDQIVLLLKNPTLQVKAYLAELAVSSTFLLGKIVHQISCSDGLVANYSLSWRLFSTPITYRLITYAHWMPQEDQILEMCT